MAEKRLGRGLSALLSDAPAGKAAAGKTAAGKTARGSNKAKSAKTEQKADDKPEAIAVAERAAAELGGGAAVKTLPIEALAPNPDQPRKHFDETKLNELAASIKEKGVLQPILVRPAKDDSYEIIAGERRWRASQKAQLHNVPVVIKDFSDQETFEIALIENIQRADLDAIEEAQGYQRLSESFGYSQNDIAKTVGKSRPHVANTLRLLELPAKVQKLVSDGGLSAGHARALIGLPDAETLAKAIVEEGLTVREAEERAKRFKQDIGTYKPKRGGAGAGSAAKDTDTIALERDLTAHLGLKVAINHKSEAAGGNVTISYKTLEQLDGIIALMRK